MKFLPAVFKIIYLHTVRFYDNSDKKTHRPFHILLINTETIQQKLGTLEK